MIWLFYHILVLLTIHINFHHIFIDSKNRGDNITPVMVYNKAKIPPASKRSEGGEYNIPQQAVSTIYRLVETLYIVTSHGEGVWKSCLKRQGCRFDL